MTTPRKTTTRKRASADPHAALKNDLRACNTLEAMAQRLGVSGKNAFRPFVRNTLHVHVSHEGASITDVKTDDALAKIVARFVK
jgi:hypothetical protein